VLDLGCGTGYGTEMLSWTARRVRGFDRWEPALTADGVRT
jgi:predicted TPR repeat methyltransferase